MADHVVAATRREHAADFTEVTLASIYDDHNRLTAAGVVSRTAAGVLGGYAFVWGFIALGMAVLFKAGMEFHDAEHLVSILGLLIFLTVFLWSFAARAISRVWIMLLSGGAVMAVAASLVQKTIIG